MLTYSQKDLASISVTFCLIRLGGKKSSNFFNFAVGLDEKRIAAFRELDRLLSAPGRQQFFNGFVCETHSY